ncbi:UNVERIFIED_CONTAM: hypothetical protein K2H54_021915 [Gekko kuhli]
MICHTGQKGGGGWAPGGHVCDRYGGERQKSPPRAACTVPPGQYTASPKVAAGGGGKEMCSPWSLNKEKKEWQHLFPVLSEKHKVSGHVPSPTFRNPPNP